LFLQIPTLPFDHPSLNGAFSSNDKGPLERKVREVHQALIDGHEFNIPYPIHPSHLTAVVGASHLAPKVYNADGLVFVKFNRKPPTQAVNEETVNVTRL
jgi:hypothetical protein